MTNGLLAFLLLVPAALVEQDRNREDLRQDPAFQHAVFLATEGEYETAAAEFDALLTAHPEHPLLLYMEGLCRFFDGEVSKGLSLLERSIDNAAPFPEAYYWTARALVRARERERAGKIVRDGLKRFPGNEKLASLLRLLPEESEDSSGPG